VKEKTICFVVSECLGFAETGGLAEVAGSLPKAIQTVNPKYHVQVVLPLYKKIKEKWGNRLQLVGEEQVELAWRKKSARLFTIADAGITYYFVEQNDYFDRDQLYGHYDDGERFAFFSKSIFSFFSLMGGVPEIIHAHDWQTALVNIYLDILYKKQNKFTKIKSLFTIHNIQYQGIFEPSFLTDVCGISDDYFPLIEYNGLVNLMKGALVCSDYITTVSPRYAKEIKIYQYAYGLEHITRMFSDKIEGILNGINTDFYNPMNDAILAMNYDSNHIELKKKNKEALQKSLHLEVRDDVCLISVISRLVNQKGLNLIVDCFQEMMDLPIQFVLLGTGDEYYEEKFLELARHYPHRVSSLITFDINLSKKIYAGADLFLMPSKTEPCGLSQMISSRYGTVPIVRATGGLFDSIKDVSDHGNGFVFKEMEASAMLEKIKEAVKLYQDQEAFLELSRKIMKIDFSWNVSASAYGKIYKMLMRK